MRANYGDVKLQIGRWYIIQQSPEKVHRMWHQCEDDPDDPDDPALYPVKFCYGNWYTRRDQSYDPQWRCLWCLEVANPDLAGAYILLEMDKTSKEVRSCLNP